MTKLLITLYVLFSQSFALLADDKGPGVENPKSDPDNYCYQQEAWKNIDNLLKDAPNDPLVIRMYAIRKGLCILIEEGKITRDQGAEIFELERSRVIIERQQDEIQKKRKVGA